MKTEKVSLSFKEGASDKLYLAALDEVANSRFVVNFAYGRRGGTLTTGTKTKAPLGYEMAKNIYDKLVKSKTAAGYIPDAADSDDADSDADREATGNQCQLLNFIAEAQVAPLLADAAWWVQEKYEGTRMLLHKTAPPVDATAESVTADSVTAMNQCGLAVEAPDIILTDARRIEQSCVIDGALVGERYVAFDLLEFGNTDLRDAPYSQRLAYLAQLGLQNSLVIGTTARTTVEKQQLFAALQSADGVSGIVFKQHNAPYTVGRPKSGGAQVKFEFNATDAVIVTN
jgi:bifunctional non-homologous end joining protein LigD